MAVIAMFSHPAAVRTGYRHHMMEFLGTQFLLDRLDLELPVSVVDQNLVEFDLSKAPQQLRADGMRLRYYLDETLGIEAVILLTQLPGEAEPMPDVANSQRELQEALDRFYAELNRRVEELREEVERAKVVPFRRPSAA